MMRPDIIVNCAMSADGKIAGRERKQVKISDQADFKRVHELRSECDAILVGVGTVIADNPSLIVKDKYVEDPSQPIRIVLDPDGRCPDEALVLDNTIVTLIITNEQCQREFQGNNTKKLSFGEKQIDLTRLLEHLYSMGIKKILVEGGGETIWHFFRARCVDRLSIFVGDIMIGGRTSPTPMDGDGFGIGEHVQLAFKDMKRMDTGIVIEYDVKAS